MSILADSDSSDVSLKINIPEVSYSDFKSTIFTFKNLDLFILPTSDPQSLEFSALIDSLEIITEANYVNLKGINLLFKSFADENGVRLDIDIKDFIYPNFNNTSINFENLDLNIAIGLNEQSLVISVNLPELTLLNKDYMVNLSDLNLDIVLQDLKLSGLDLSIAMADFHYTNFDDVLVDMNNVNVSLEPISDSNNFNVFIRMNALDATGLTSFDELFPMLNITAVNFKSPTADSESPVNLTGLMSLLDISKMDLSELASLLSSGFDIDAYTSNMPNQQEGSIDVDAVDITSTDSSDSDDSGFDLGSVFENCDYSCLNTIVLDLNGLIDSIDIDLADFGIDLSDYDLSAISVSDIIDALNNSDFNISAITSILKLFSLDLDDFNMSDLIVSFDPDKFDISSLLASLNLSGLDIQAIIDMFNNSDVDWGSVFEGCDYSCLDAFVLDLNGLIDSIGIDLADFGIDLSDYDLSAISLSNLIDLLNNADFTSELDLSGLKLDNLDMSKLIVSFDSDNFDISSLLDSLDLSDVEFFSILGTFINSDVDWGSVFEGCDYSCLDAFVLDLNGLLDSIGIDLADFGIDVSDYDLSAISLSDIIDILNDSEFIKSSITAMLKLFSLDLDNFDMSELIVSFDSDNFDISGLLDSLNLSGLDISGILNMFNMDGFDLTEFLNNLLSMFLESAVPEVSNVQDNKLICQSDVFCLECLNKLFNTTFINGHLKVCVDGELVFEDDTADDLTQEIFEITDKCLGEHEITVEFTDSQEKSSNYEEKIMVE